MKKSVIRMGMLKEFSIEMWKDVKGHEGYYQVSSFGNVRSLNYRRTGRVQNLKIQYRDKNRFSFIALYRDGFCEIMEVNRLVYEVFVQEVDMNYDIVHIDGNYKNNRLSNLKQSDKNADYAIRLYFVLIRKQQRLLVSIIVKRKHLV